jgi:hypothetical protein
MLQVSPKRLYGWLPRTFHHYDDDGRVAWTVTESDWADPYERALIDAYLDWKTDLHTCGRHLSESLQGARDDIDEESYAAGYQVCSACMALEYRRAELAKADEAERERGRNPEAWRLWRVDLLPEAEAIWAAQQHKKS